MTLLLVSRVKLLTSQTARFLADLELYFAESELGSARPGTAVTPDAPEGGTMYSESIVPSSDLAAPRLLIVVHLSRVVLFAS